MANPEGDSQLLSGQVAVIVFAAASKRTISFLLSILAKTVPVPSATGNSGLPSRRDGGDDFAFVRYQSRLHYCCGH